MPATPRARVQACTPAIAAEAAVAPPPPPCACRLGCHRPLSLPSAWLGLWVACFVQLGIKVRGSIFFPFQFFEPVTFLAAKDELRAAAVRTPRRQVARRARGHPDRGFPPCPPRHTGVQRCRGAETDAAAPARRTHRAWRSRSRTALTDTPPLSKCTATEYSSARR